MSYNLLRLNENESPEVLPHLTETSLSSNIKPQKPGCKVISHLQLVQSAAARLLTNNKRQDHFSLSSMVTNQF